jgi:hypothetical protein
LPSAAPISTLIAVPIEVPAMTRSVLPNAPPGSTPIASRFAARIVAPTGATPASTGGAEGASPSEPSIVARAVRAIADASSFGPEPAAREGACRGSGWAPPWDSGVGGGEGVSRRAVRRERVPGGGGGSPSSARFSRVAGAAQARFRAVWQMVSDGRPPARLPFQGGRIFRDAAERRGIMCLGSGGLPGEPG